MELVGSFIRFFVIMFVTRTLFNMYFSFKHAKRQREAEALREERNSFPTEDHKEVVVEMVQDPICGVYVAKDRAYQVVEEAETKYFCSWECRQQYIQQNQ